MSPHSVTVSPGSPIDALHEVGDAACRASRGWVGLEDDDVAAVDVVEVVAELVDEHAVADLERRHHRLGRDVERLEEERLDDERDDDRGDEQDPPLDGRPAEARLLPRRLRRRVVGGLRRQRPLRRSRDDAVGSVVAVTSSVTKDAPRLHPRAPETVQRTRAADVSAS